MRADAAAKCDGLLGVCLRQEQGEFIAADTKREIGRAQRLSQSRSRKLQHLIALQVAVTVVHFFQFVQIQDHDGQLMTITFRAIQFLVKDIRRRGGDCRDR